MDSARTAVPETTIDLDLAARLLAGLNPPISPRRIEAQGTAGFRAAIFFVDAVRGPPLVIKVYPHEPWWRPAKEIYVAALLAGANKVHAPRFLSADSSRTILPHRYAIMTRLPGERLTLCEIRMSDPERVAMWREVGAQLRLIHAIPMEAFGFISNGRLAARSATNRVYMDICWRSKMTQFRELGGGDALAAAMDEKWSERADLLDICRTPRLCHCDIHPGNLLAAQGQSGWRLTGVLDFEDSVAGDPLLDLAKCAHFARAGDGARWRGLMEGYGRIENATWEETIDLYQLYQTLVYWVWIVFLRRPQRERDAALAGLTSLVDRL